VTDDTKARIEVPTGSTGTLTQLYLGLVWLATSMYTAHATITGGAEGISGAFGAAAEALPGVVAATLVTSAGIGHAASSRFRGPGGRLLAGLALGVLFGLIAAAGIRFGYGSEPSITVFAVIVGVASVLGGALAILPNEVLEAALWATTWVFFAGVIFGVFQVTLLDGVGTGAAERLALGQSLLTGLIAAVYASRTLRTERAAWPWFLVAGALPGLLLLAAEILTRIGGSSLVALVTGFSAGEPTLVELTDAARLRHALVVAGVGGVVALIAGLRAKRQQESEEDTADDSDDDDSD
jgi:hypothetical protein